MTDTAGTSPRERYRAQVRAEIKQRAWEQLATTGVAALSLNAIAKQLGLSGPALYRYYASRDDLLTELIRDAYRSLADTIQARAAAGADLAGLAHAFRDWARADPQRYFLIYGTPVPGYHAPEDTTRISAEIMAVVIDASAARPVEAPDTPLDAELGRHRRWAGENPAPPAILARALSFWTRVHGVLSLELAGHFEGMEFDPAVLFADEVERLSSR
ncbi:TetR/AcrR family transcriptional regulator [Amycolatopsis sp. PS_44_ISF1]|uniref:TetR/AcrR family transcriptional regulator n=1 Tax=Amycolatopsis sp. PS_44_ISF1 TaxID=2974917 RepID=UPI0028DD5A81|nr:TetR/AcrR family transcriptional regulator [Amycolatopsis sp. PS_44_ISF1]MDT8913226.1 TetR/AcrR family transcriptional regulator [Amycolatopsis sp. PS_44_ISF1]